MNNHQYVSMVLRFPRISFVPKIEWYLLVCESNVLMRNQYFFLRKKNQSDKTMAFILA